MFSSLNMKSCTVCLVVQTGWCLTEREKKESAKLFLSGHLQGAEEWLDPAKHPCFVLNPSNSLLLQCEIGTGIECTTGTTGTRAGLHNVVCRSESCQDSGSGMLKKLINRAREQILNGRYIPLIVNIHECP